MKVAIILLTFSLLLVQCSPKGRSRDFFVKTKAYPDFSRVEQGMRLWGLDSLAYLLVG